MRLIVVPHGKKLENVGAYARELAADPPMTMEGKAKMLTLVPALKKFGPYYHTAYCSLMDRACGTMCTIVKKLGINRVVCIDELGQYGNLNGDTVIAYPGHEADNVLTWQKQGWEAAAKIRLEVESLIEKTVLIFTHRPILAGLVALASYTTDVEGIQKILAAKELVGQGFRIFNLDARHLTLEA